MYSQYLKKCTKRGIEMWSVESGPSGYTITYGLENGKKQSRYVKTSPKSQSTPEKQAEFEAEALAQKKIRLGYRLHLNDISLAATPMLAHKFDYKKAIFPAYIQPKLDGVRCLYKHNQMYTRTNKLITTLPHIQTACDVLTKKYQFWLDGELMWPGHTFQELISVIKRNETHKYANEITYNIFDIVLDKVFHERSQIIKRMKDDFLPCLQYVPTILINSMDEMFEYHNQFVADGFEGAIYRGYDLWYEFSRSQRLMKIKDTFDEEYEIVDGELDKNGECVFVCKIAETGQTFKVKPVGDHSKRAAYWRDLPDLIGKPLTVKYIKKSDDGIPSHAVGVEIRDYE